MVGEQGGGRLAVVRLLDGRRHPPVQIESSGAPEAGADRLADQGVGHVEPPGAVLDEQSGGDGDVGGVEQVVAAEAAGVDEDRQGGGVAGDGGEVQDLDDAWVEAIEAQADHRPDRLGELVADVALGVADQLGQEERVAAGGGVQLGGLGSVVAGEPQQLGDGVGGEGIDTETGQQPIAGEGAGDAFELRRRVVGGDPDRPEHHHSAGQLVAQHVLDHLERRGVGPLQVVEDDEHRVDR